MKRIICIALILFAPSFAGAAILCEEDGVTCYEVRDVPQDAHNACDSEDDCNQWASSMCGPQNAVIVSYASSNGVGVSCSVTCWVPMWGQGWMPVITVKAACD
jgi:hypothetical protein